MKKMRERLLRDTRGQDLAEYGLALAVVGIVAASAATRIAIELRPLWLRPLQRIILTIIGLGL
jgi:Flp pilus assembly pilin Flp